MPYRHARMPRNYRPPRGGMGELPETLLRERQPGRILDPSAGLYIDWINRYKANNFGILIGTASQTVLQEHSLRTYLLIQNNHAANILFIAFNSEANTFSSVHIQPGGFYELIGGEAGGSFCPKSSLNLAANAADTHVVIVEGSLEPMSQAKRTGE